MPEGPEVETIRRGLLDVIQKNITKVKVAKSKKFYQHSKEINSLISSTIIDIERKGKFLIFKFSKNNTDSYALNHLGMTGVWHYYSDDIWKNTIQSLDNLPHWKVYFQLSDNSHLIFVNIRTFGRFEICSIDTINHHSSINNLGPDILEDVFDSSLFINRVRGNTKKPKTREIGKALLDSKIVSGCGNIYKNEALFLSNINPFTPSNLLSDKQLSTLAKNLHLVGHKALKFKGSTLRDYKHVDGYSGLMQNEFLVYDRQGETCNTCKSKILKSTQGDRASYWCINCQNNYLPE